MRTVLKVVLGIVLVIVVIAGAGIGYLAARKPAQRPPSTETVERTPARLARGEYLVKYLCDCEGCHSDHRFDLFGWPVKPGTELQGGFKFDEKLGVPGVVQAQNLTPDPETGKGNWTDGEIMRAFREGVSRDGHALFPMMPYEYYHSMSDEDAKSVVVYLRSVKPVHKVIEPSSIAFPVNLLIKGAPQPLAGPVATPDDATDHLAYGKYLVTLAGCRECHTPHDDHGQPVPGKDFSGGWVMAGPWGRVVTANITPDPGTFIGKATKEIFVARFKQFAGMAEPPPVQPGRGTVMNWLGMSRLTEKDLGAIFDYLKTLPPIEHEVNSFPDAK
jgi:mono/diheme cytochrome c family protein